MAEKDNASSGNVTRVDLGEDLLEKTAILVTPRASPEQAPRVAPVAESESIRVENIPDYLQTAQILVSEGITEEAKRILRKIVSLDPLHGIARQLLEQIHDIELRQIFSDERRGRRSDSTEPQFDLSTINSDQIIDQLDQDLQLGMGTFSLFEDRRAMDQFAVALDKISSKNSPRDFLDMGIAFLEMGLPEIAARQFRAAVNKLGSDSNPEMELSAKSLLAYALLVADRAFEAVLVIERVLGDSELRQDQKIDFFYLMGRAYEGLRKPENAQEWYRQAYEVDPDYRDVAERLR